MSVIVVANPKGGVGKSTLATHVAGALAKAGHAVMLGDVDRQQSSRQWLALRPPQLPLIRSWEVSHHDIVRPPKGTTHVVLDTPAGLHGKRLDAVLRIATKMLIPLQPSLFEWTTHSSCNVWCPKLLLQPARSASTFWSRSRTSESGFIRALRSCIRF